MDSFRDVDVVPLTYSRRIAGNRVSGLAVTVQVTNAATGVSLLAATNCPEVSNSGIYNYNWTHGLNQTTQCLVAFKYGTTTYEDSFLIEFGPSGGRGA